ncbi:MAG: prepilin peptidase [Deltaproteobacteria bacterium]|nr:prepilin peptidase [Deltaproteobacteria bacterium]MBN2670787.1 prepilin peptidase [Deltaproteobacteria bacterium]
MSDILNLIPSWQILLAAGVFGALWGSFANVVIVRWPREMSVVKPASHCFSCKTPVKFYDNIPVLSYIILRGKCRHCGAPFSFRYAAVELCMGLLSVGVAQVTLVGSSDPLLGLAAYFIWFFFVWALVTVAMIDLEHYLIPDVIVLPGIVVGLSANIFVLRNGMWEYVVATVVAYAAIRLLFIDGYRLLTGRAGMGEGDAKLLAMFGAFLGYEGVLFALFAGALQGTIVGVVMILVRRKDGDLNEPVFEEEVDEDGEPLEPDERFGKARVPFGPFLALGALEYIFVGEHFLRAYAIALGHFMYDLQNMF